MKPFVAALVTAVATSACSPSLAPVVTSRQVAGSGDTPVHLHMAQRAPDEQAALLVRLAEPPRAVQTLPASWDTATLTLQHPTALTQLRSVTLAKGVGIVQNGSTYVATGAFGNLRPVSGYTLTVDLWNGGANGDLVAEKQVPVSLAAGVNNVTVSTAVYSFGFTSFSPTAAGSGDTVVLTGTGFSVLPWQDQVSLNGTTAPISSPSSVSISAQVPDIGPSDTTVSWQVQVGTSVASVAGFTVLGILGSALAWATSPDGEQQPDIAWGSDRYLVSWFDSNTKYVYGKMVDSSGNTLVSTFTIDGSGIANNQPRSAYDPATSQFLTVNQFGSNSGDIYGQLENASGTLSGSDFAICNTSAAQTNPAVAYDGVNNQYLATWTDGRSGTNQIRGNIVSSSGTLAASSLALATGTYGQDDSSVAFDPSTHQYLLVYDEAQTKKVIKGTLLNSDRSVAVAPFTIAPLTGSDQKLPVAAWDSDSGDFMVVWLNSQSPNLIQAQRVSSAGSLVGSGITLANYSASKNNPRIAYQPWRKKFMATWDDNRSGKYNIFAQHFTIDGALWGGNFHVTSGGSNNDTNSALAVSPSAKESMVAYQQNTNASDIYGQVIR